MTIHAFLLGFIFATSLGAGLFFLQFWLRTHDRLFLAFAAAFTIEGFNRLTFLIVPDPNEIHPITYLVRFLAFLLIVVAIIAKNRRSPAG